MDNSVCLGKARLGASERHFVGTWPWGHWLSYPERLQKGDSHVAVSTVAYVGLGSNLGDRQAMIDLALGRLGQQDQVEVLRSTEVYETTPLTQDGQPNYLNAVAEIRTSLAPHGLLQTLQTIENELGRERKERWGARTIDLDLLLYGSEILQSEALTLPHVQMHLRSFVLEPLCQLTEDLVHPVLGVDMDELRQRLNGQNFAVDAAAPQLVSIAGNIGVGKTTLAERLQAQLGGQVLYEPYDTNPFMPDVYAGKTELALDSQLHFLVHRAQQLQRCSLTGGRAYFSDYLFEKELLYAEQLLDERQWTLYQQIYEPFAARVTEPSLVIYMQDSSDHCLTRIHQRNRAYEQGIQTSFLDGLSDAYDTLIANWQKSPILRLDISAFDCLRADHMEALIAQVRAYVRIL